MEHVIEGCQCPGKKCATCKETKCYGLFIAAKGRKNGIRSPCKACQNKKCKAWREKNHEYDLERRRIYHATHKEEEKRKHAEWRRNNREISRVRGVRWQKRHPEKYREVWLRRNLRRSKDREIARNARLLYQEIHKDEIENQRIEKRRAAFKEYYWANKEWMNERVRKHQKAHPDMHARRSLIRRTRKTQAGGSYTLEEWGVLKAQYDYRCLCCGKQEPDIKLTADHIIPVSKGGTSYIENIQPLCKSCNSSKGTKTIDFRPSQQKDIS